MILKAEVDRGHRPSQFADASWASISINMKCHAHRSMAATFWRSSSDFG
jgi:hypothetical protein